MTEHETGFAQVSLGLNAYRPVTPDLRAVGVRTHQLRFDNLGVDQNATAQRIAEEFLLASRLRAHDRDGQLSTSDYFGDMMVTVLAQLDDDPVPPGRTVDLPERLPVTMQLDEAALRRRSVRGFSGDPVSLAELGTLLRIADGVTAEADVELLRGGHETFRFRTAPSGGGLYPIALHVAALDVTGLPAGLYRYQPVRDLLVREGDRGQMDRVLEAFDHPGTAIGLDTAAALVVMVATPWRSMRKYGPRGLRFALHEAGAIAQNMHLAVTALGLGSSDCASFLDDPLHTALGVDGTMRAAVHSVIVGRPE
ncbi:SagB-type dehydrogenase family enzyme [Amycolatopsis lexingtonensis]|uniref:SagB-type dehydrogenase family enzyme n=1 Tax=Amycolatopsis lexingtonensis TaxID=218822 RepID=A0ABR9HQF2_9PSEU|nr:SagB/ThcOx family dehydrogenase [Amycolatopsis lexingtonensis]MBE1493146.1 SagB-type dehydrogenase family enzyme [Amycolatopsis lexingtonensis]